jgi:hypothetical protein
MDRVYKSKVSWLYHFGLFILIGCLAAAFIKGASVVTMIALLLGTLLMVNILLTTWYKITDKGELIAHCGIFPEKRILISEITYLEASVMPVSSYALSLDRIIIYKGDQVWLLVSPNNKKDFVAQLRKINPEIQIKEPII